MDYIVSNCCIVWIGKNSYLKHIVIDCEGHKIITKHKEKLERISFIFFLIVHLSLSCKIQNIIATYKFIVYWMQSMPISL